MKDSLEALKVMIADLRGAVRQLRVWVALTIVGLVLSVGAVGTVAVSAQQSQEARRTVKCLAIADMDVRLRGRVVEALDAWAHELALVAGVPDEAVGGAIAKANDAADEVLSRPVKMEGCE